MPTLRSGPLAQVGGPRRCIRGRLGGAPSPLDWRYAAVMAPRYCIPGPAAPDHRNCTVHHHGRYHVHTVCTVHAYVPSRQGPRTRATVFSRAQRGGRGGRTPIGQSAHRYSGGARTGGGGEGGVRAPANFDSRGPARGGGGEWTRRGAPVSTHPPRGTRVGVAAVGGTPYVCSGHPTGAARRAWAHRRGEAWRGRWGTTEEKPFPRSGLPPRRGRAVVL